MLIFLFQFLVYCAYLCHWLCKIWSLFSQASVKYAGCFCVFSGLCELWRLFLCLFRPPNPIEYLAAFLLKNKSQYEWMIIIVSLLSSLACFHFGLFLHISLFSLIASDITKSGELCKNETWEWLESAQISGCSSFC